MQFSILFLLGIASLAIASPTAPRYPTIVARQGNAGASCGSGNGVGTCNANGECITVNGDANPFGDGECFSNDSAAGRGGGFSGAGNSASEAQSRAGQPCGVGTNGEGTCNALGNCISNAGDGSTNVFANGDCR